MRIHSERDPHKIISPLTPKEGNLKFSRVSFRYRPDTAPSLLGVSFNAHHGELVAVTGRNGSGKSTLLKMIPRIYQPQAGTIKLNNVNTLQIDVVELRHAIAYMPQNTSLFYGTIAQNLRFSNLTATEDELVFATKMAGVYEEIMRLPKQFSTPISDNHQMLLSASFKQKIALARIYLKKSKIVLGSFRNWIYSNFYIIAY